MAKGRRTDRPKPVLPDLAEVFKNLIAVTDTPFDLEKDLNQFDFETLLQGKGQEEITEDLAQRLVEEGWLEEDIQTAKAKGFMFSQPRGTLIKLDMELGGIYEAFKTELKFHALTT